MTPRLTAAVEFNAREILNREAKRDRRVLFRAGAYARTVMRRLMKRRKGPSSPGDPPHAHAGDLKEKIRFDVDPVALDAVAGPIQFDGKGDTQTSKTIPALLNEGGRATVKLGGKRVRARYRPRPFTDQANETAAERLADLIANETL